MVECPRCGSEKLNKQGKRNGKQRYTCTNCLAHFTEGVEYTEATSYEKLNKRCPHCGGTHIRRAGNYKSGVLRYLCVNCHKIFSEKTKINNIEYNCPYCNGTLRPSGYGKFGQRRYRCKDCGKVCLGSLDTSEPIKKLFFKDINTDIKCPVCGSQHLRKTGLQEGKKQRYYCKDCGKYFINDYVKALRTKETKEEAINLLLKGTSVKDIIDKYKYSSKHIKDFMKPFYNAEKLTKEQKQLIIKYGHFLKVPVDYLAPYVHCSEYACKKLLNKYRKKLKAKSTSSYGI